MRKSNAPQANHVNADEAQRMFEYWCEVHGASGYTGVARKFKRDINTVRRTAKKYDWIQRLKEIEERRQQHSDDAIVAKKNLLFDQISEITDLVAKRILKALKKPASR